jgi:hypothetical protein
MDTGFEAGFAGKTSCTTFIGRAFMAATVCAAFEAFSFSSLAVAAQEGSSIASAAALLGEPAAMPGVAPPRASVAEVEAAVAPIRWTWDAEYTRDGYAG